tara:strand:- start:508 stop:747 length:240 start_codon:yes stop_codon:yes gene_type:complete
MPISKYTLIGKIVYSVCKMDSSKLKKIAKELKVLSMISTRPVSKKSKRKTKSKSRKKATPAQLRARKLFAQRVKRGDFR